ncbi:CLUMA_CG018123, isoform A, partial [Clunio marinus]
ISSYSVAFEPANCKNRTTVSWRIRERIFFVCFSGAAEINSYIVEANLAKRNLDETVKNDVEKLKFHFFY